MVLPDDPRSDPRPPVGRRLLFAGAASALAVGTLALGALTAPDEPLAVPTTLDQTTTTFEELDRPIDLENFTVAEIATGEPLELSAAVALSGDSPGDLVSHDGWIYVFGRGTSWLADAGLTAWRTRDGLDWQELGQVIPEGHRIGAVTSTGQGLVALETMPNQPGFNVWRSVDASSWQSEFVPVELENEYMTVYPSHAGGSDRLLIVTGHVSIDGERLIRERLQESLGLDLAEFHYGWGSNQGADGATFSFYGPLGIPALTVTGAELGLTEQEEDWLTHGYEPSAHTEVWSSLTGLISGEGLGWRRSTIEGAAWTEAVVVKPDFEAILYGYSNVGASSWRSFDNGVTWEREDGGGIGHPYMVRPWGGDDFAGLASNGTVSVMVSDEGDEWHETSLREHFPTELSWAAGPLAASTAGLAVAVEGWNESSALAAPEPASITRDGVTLTIEPTQGRVSIEFGDVVTSWPTHSETLPDNVTLDLAQSLLTVHDPDTDDPLVSFTFDEIEAADASTYEGEWQQGWHRALAFSRDGETWSIQDVALLLGDGTHIRSLALTDDRLVALVMAAVPDGSAASASEIWTAPLP